MKTLFGTGGHDAPRTDSGADQPLPMSSTVALNKNAFPTRQHMPANLFNSAQFSCVGVQAQNQAFVRFAVMSSAAQTAIALNSTSVLEPFNRRGSRSREPLFRPAYAGVLHRFVSGT